MERAEAEAIYDQGRETVVAVLLRMDEQIQQLTRQVAKQGEQIAELERRLNRNSRNSSTPPSQDPPGAPQRGFDPDRRQVCWSHLIRDLTLSSESIGRGGASATTPFPLQGLVLVGDRKPRGLRQLGSP